MKNKFMLAGLIVVLFACNNKAKEESNTNDTTAIHHKATDTSIAAENKQIQETMNNMMQKMHSVNHTGNIDIDFSTMMIEHHKGAVEMSKVEINKGTNAELKEFAQKVINDQEKEIAFMQDFISKAPKSVSPASDNFQKALNNSMMAMMDQSTANYKNIDQNFAAQMIPHHQSAVDMAKAYLEYGQESSLKMLCQDIINSQTKEINWLKDLLAKRM
ncbi:MAG: DUF305 domain-containing protein [Ferruginibacter sp.]